MSSLSAIVFCLMVLLPPFMSGGLPAEKHPILFIFGAMGIVFSALIEPLVALLGSSAEEDSSFLRPFSALCLLLGFVDLIINPEMMALTPNFAGVLAIVVFIICTLSRVAAEIISLSAEVKKWRKQRAALLAA